MSTDTSIPALQGIKVLEIGTLIAGPYAASLLGQFGAEVIKIESPDGGDPLRTWRKMHDGTSLWWYSQSRNKKSVTLDLKQPRAQEIVRQLVREADIVIENFRPGTLEKWGLGWDTLSAINPSLIMVRVSGYGQSGPYKDRPGFAAIAESMGGLRHVTGYPDRPPVRAGVSIGDTLASLYGVIGALMALHHLKSGSGKGQFVDVALYEAVFGVMESLIPEYSALGHVRERTGSARGRRRCTVASPVSTARLAAVRRRLPWPSTSTLVMAPQTIAGSSAAWASMAARRAATQPGRITSSAESGSTQSPWHRKPWK